MRTLWVCSVAGGPQGYVGTRPGHDALALEEAHRNLHIAPEEFDAVAGILARTLDEFNVPETEKGEVLAAFAAHKGEVTEGSRQPAGAIELAPGRGTDRWQGTDHLRHDAQVVAELVIASR